MMALAGLKSPRWALAVAAVLALCAILVARFLSGRGVIATLSQADGAVERDRRAAVGTWVKAPLGAEFVFGDGVKTGTSSHATLGLFDRSRLALEPNTLVRFLDRPSGSKPAKLDVQMGGATLESGDAELDVDLTVCSARLASHSKVQLVRDGAALRLAVVIGSARMLDAKELIELTVGKAVEILPDHSVRAVEPDRPEQARSDDAAPTGPADGAGPTPPAESVAQPVPEASAGGRSRGPQNVDFSATAGESFVLHDGRPPTAIGLSQSECPGAALLSLSSRGATRATVGERRLSALVPAGTHRYTVSCLDERGEPGPPVARGTITVLADAGTRLLAKTAPGSNVETDGRRYTILYQSLLPRISVSWPNPPEAAGYTLSVRSSSGTKTLRSKTASHTFPAGALAEGEHALVFEAAGKRSRSTDVVIRFDNAAPTASIVSPSDGSFAPGARVVVSGAALPGWSVSAEGTELTRDEQNRFSGEVTAPAGGGALVIRFSHPSRGVQYYLRRSAGK